MRIEKRKPIPESMRQYVLKRDYYMCFACKTSESSEVHHLIPRVMGGRTIVTNLVGLCHMCHKNVPEDYDANECRRLFIEYCKRKGSLYLLYMHRYQKEIKVDSNHIKMVEESIKNLDNSVMPLPETLRGKRTAISNHKNTLIRLRERLFDLKDSHDVFDADDDDVELLEEEIKEKHKIIRNLKSAIKEQEEQEGGDKK